MPLLVVRHANAGRRSAYKGDDRLRPLSVAGHTRAAALVVPLSEYRPARILSSPFVRCFETVQPLAEGLGLSVEPVEALAEGHGPQAVTLLTSMSAESAVLCTHGDVALAILESLVPDPGDDRRSELRLQKGEFWVIQPSQGSLEIVEHIRRVNRNSRSR
jgi:8-oxo-(d)GTP phosphatase